jgi:hypothetical protein
VNSPHNLATTWGCLSTVGTAQPTRSCIPSTGWISTEKTRDRRRCKARLSPLGHQGEGRHGTPSLNRGAACYLASMSLFDPTAFRPGPGDRSNAISIGARGLRKPD